MTGQRPLGGASFLEPRVARSAHLKALCGGTACIQFRSNRLQVQKAPASNLPTYWMERPGYETISLPFNTRPPALRDLA